MIFETTSNHHSEIKRNPRKFLLHLIQNAPISRKSCTDIVQFSSNPIFYRSFQTRMGWDVKKNVLIINETNNRCAFHEYAADVKSS